MGVYKRGAVYWISYSYKSKQYRESAHTSKKEEAEELLAARKAEIRKKKLSGPSPITEL